MPPLGALSLGASLERHGFHASINDTQFEPRITPFDVDAFADLLKSCSAETIALSLFNDAIPLVVAALEQIGGELKERRIFIGGPGTTGIAERLVQRLSCVEAVVVGEGETLLPLLLARDHEATRMPGVFSRSIRGAVVGIGRARRETLDELPFPDWTWCLGRGYSVVPLSTMRGCPFDCHFCDVAAFTGRRVTMRSIDRALSDLAVAMRALDTNEVSVLDDTFTVSKARVLAFCRELKRRELGARFSIYSRVDLMDEEIMAELASAGCYRVFFGLDGGDEAVIAAAGKRLDLVRAKSVLAMCARYCDVTASFIWGYPFETVDAFHRLLDLAEELWCTKADFCVYPQLHLLSPASGTYLFTQYAAQMVLDTDVELLPLRNNLKDHGSSSGYGKVLETIRSDEKLAAPFFRYQSPRFAYKRSTVRAFQMALHASVGKRILE